MKFLSLAVVLIASAAAEDNSGQAAILKQLGFPECAIPCVLKGGAASVEKAGCSALNPSCSCPGGKGGEIAQAETTKCLADTKACANSPEDLTTKLPQAAAKACGTAVNPSPTPNPTPTPTPAPSPNPVPTPNATVPTPGGTNTTGTSNATAPVPMTPGTTGEGSAPKTPNATNSSGGSTPPAIQSAPNSANSQHAAGLVVLSLCVLSSVLII